MKTKLTIFILCSLFAAPAFAEDDQIADIQNRYSALYAQAGNSCPGLTEKINQVKVMAGIGIGAGAVGTLAGGAAVVTGVMKNTKDGEITDLENDVLKLDYTEEDFGKMTKAEILALLTKFENYVKQDDEKKTPDADAKQQALTTADEEAKKLGTIRTVTAFGAGATGAVGAVTAFSGVGMLDKLIEEMDACDSAVRGIENLATELRFAEPDHPDLAQMNNIVESCKGLSSKNIEDVKGKLKIAGISSTVGAAAGIAGGVTSAMANNKEAGHGLNTAATITSGVAAVGNLGGAILSGITLSGLIKNGEIAAACGDAFGSFQQQ